MNHDVEKEILPISVLIPTMNRPNTLEQTIQSFLKFKYIPSQLVIIDQSEKENEANEIQKIVDNFQKNEKRIEITYVYQHTPSLTVARNTAMRMAKEEIVICSDDDIELEELTLFNIKKIMDNQEIAMIAGMDKNSSKSTTNIGYLLGTKSYKYRKIGHVTLSVLGRYPDEIIGQVETQWAMGYFFVIRKSLVCRWKIKWDENLTGYAYAEDLDFSYSYYKLAKKERLKCILIDKIKVRHMVSKEYRIPTRKSTYMYIIHRAYLCYKHHMGMKSQIAMQWCNFWRMIERKAKHESIKDMLEAQKLCKELKKNNFNSIKDVFVKMK